MSTYLQIINIVLRDVNEVPLKAADFATARGIQDYVKQSVNRAYLDIVSSSTEWPWLLNTSGTNGNTAISTVQGTRYYSLGAPHNLDTETFTITDAAGDLAYLKYVPYDHWLRNHKELETDASAEAQPRVFFKHPGSGLWGMSPVPDAIYTVSFTKWNPATRFTADSDLIPFDVQFENVLISRAMYFVWTWRENLDHANMNKKDYEKGLKLMQSQVLTNKLERIRAE